MDGRPRESSPNRTFQGDPVGHWEGDTLVVDVTNFRARPKISNRWFETWSDELHVVERWTRPDARFFEYEMSAEDPKTLTRPWTAPVLRRGRMAYDMAQENFCIQDSVLEQINNQQLAASEKGAGRLNHPWDKWIPK